MNNAEMHALYRFFDEHGELLYVGITNNPGRRWSQHSADKPWWHEVHHVELERHPDRASVLAAEAQAIRTEAPRYNLAGVAKVLSPSGVVEWFVACDSCAEAATTIYLLGAEVHAYTTWQQRMHDPRVPFADKVISGEDLFNTPSPARWRMCCEDHYPGDDVVDWWTRGVTSRRAGVDLIRHLSEKDWVGRNTDWAQLAVRLLAPAEAALPRGHAW